MNSLALSLATARAAARDEVHGCEVCGDRRSPIRPSFGWKLALALAYLSMPTMVFLGAMSGLMMVVTVPLAGVIVAGVLGPLHELALATPRCRGCDRYRYDNP